MDKEQAGLFALGLVALACVMFVPLNDINRVVEGEMRAQGLVK